MKKRIAFRKLGRTTSHKWAMLRNMVSSLIRHERIVTTVPKAKELRHVADQMVTLAKSDSRLHAIRQAAAIIREKPMLTKLFEVLGPRYRDREGGYTRIMKLSKNRAGDNAPMAVIEYVDRPGEIRAARPPSSFQRNVLHDVLKKVGIAPVTDEQIELFRKGIARTVRSPQKGVADPNVSDSSPSSSGTENEVAKNESEKTGKAK